MNRKLVHLFMLLSLSACSSAAPDFDGTTADDAQVQTGGDVSIRSGARLRARGWVLAGSSGTVAETGVLAGWHDDQLDLDCELVPSVDGTVRCLPLELSISTVYSTPTCQPESALAELMPNREGLECPGGFGIYDHYPSDGGPVRYGAVKLGRPVAASRTTHGYLRNAFGQCVPFSDQAVVPGLDRIYCEMVEQPDIEFAVATSTLEPAGVASVTRYTTDDGATQPAGLVHPTLGVPLAPWFANLVPVVPAYSNGPGTGTFADAACTQTIICAGGDADVVPPLLVVGNQCSMKTFHAGPAPTAAYWREADGTCVPNTPDVPASSCRTLVDEVPAIPRKEVALGAGRLKPKWLAPEGAPLTQADRYFYDAALDWDCTPRRASDGKLRCLPDVYIPGGWAPAFDDEECTEAIGVTGETNDTADTLGCGLVPRFRVFGSDVARLTPGEDGAKVYRHGFGPESKSGCEPLPRGTAWYRSETMDPAELAELVEKVD